MKKTLRCVLIIWLVILFSAFSFACGGNSNTTTVSSLSVQNYKKIFVLGDEFSIGNLEVTVHYSDGTTKIAAANDYTIDSSDFASNAVGSFDITVKLNETGTECVYRVDVVEVNEIDSIKVSGAKTLFGLNEEFTTEGLIVTKNYVDVGEGIADPSEYVVDSSSYDAKKEGDYIITVLLLASGKSATYVVKVRSDYSQSLKILAIGNSFSDDATAYLHQIAKANGGQQVFIGNLFVGGCTVAQHRAFAESDSPAYEYRKNTSGSFVSIPNVKLSTALKDMPWDVIVMQQASHDSGKSATYNADIDYLINYVNARKINAEAKLAWHMTWAYQSDSSHGAFPDYGRNQMTMYNRIVEAVQTKIVPNKAFSIVFPAGTAIQNARTSYLGDTLTRDGYHLSIPVGRYIAAFTWYMALTNKPAAELKHPSLPDLSPQHYPMILESVQNAVKNPYAVTQSVYTVAPKT